eukprot:6786547-Pyramimonas_sp.AAC.1
MHEEARTPTSRRIGRHRARRAPRGGEGMVADTRHGGEAPTSSSAARCGPIRFASSSSLA